MTAALPRPHLASPAALRDWIAARPAEAREDALSGLLRAEAARGAAPGEVVLSLTVSHPKLLRAAAAPLLEEPAARAYATAALVRLHDRRGEHAARRALLLDRLRDEKAAAWDERTELLRTELLDPSADDAEPWRVGTHRVSANCRISYELQRAVARGQRPRAGPLLARLAKAQEEALAAAPPELLRLAEAREIALVGNGSGLAGSGAAARIEAHDLVVRVNYPPVAVFAADVGTRTDVMLIRGPHAAAWAEMRAREPGHGALPALALHGARPEALPGEAPCLPPGLARLLSQVTYQRATTGFRAIMLLAVALRRKVTLFGFDFFRPGAPGHYFGGGLAVPVHEPAYERWFAARVLPVLAPRLVALDRTSSL